MKTIDHKSPEFLYLQLKKVLQKDLQDGKYKPDDSIPSIRELAQKYKVSLFPVKKAVSELTEEGILYRRWGRGTYLAPSLKEKKQIRTIPKNKEKYYFLKLFLSTPQIFERKFNPTSYFVPFDILQGISRACKTFQCYIDLVFTSNVNHQSSSYFNLNDGVCDGIILLETTLVNILPKIKKLSLPYIAIDPDIKNSSMNVISVDAEKGVFEAVTHLIKLGHKRIGFIGGSFNVSAHQDRLKGYKKALQEKKLNYQEKLVVECQAGTEKEGFLAMLKLLKLKDKPTAVFAASDLRAIGAMRAIKERRFRIPNDMAVVGFDDIKEAFRQYPPLTTVKYPRYELGYQAVKMLIESIKHNRYEINQLKLSPKLIIRKSCGG